MKTMEAIIHSCGTINAVQNDQLYMCKGGALVLMRELVYFIKGGACDSGKMWVVEEWPIDRMYGSLLIEGLKTIHFQKRLFCFCWFVLQYLFPFEHKLNYFFILSTGLPLQRHKIGAVSTY